MAAVGGIIFSLITTGLIFGTLSLGFIESTALGGLNPVDRPDLDAEILLARQRLEKPVEECNVVTFCLNIIAQSISRWNDVNSIFSAADESRVEGYRQIPFIGIYTIMSLSLLAYAIIRMGLFGGN